MTYGVLCTSTGLHITAWAGPGALSSDLRSKYSTSGSDPKFITDDINFAFKYQETLLSHYASWTFEVKEKL